MIIEQDEQIEVEQEEEKQEQKGNKTVSDINLSKIAVEPLQEKQIYEFQKIGFAQRFIGLIQMMFMIFVILALYYSYLNVQNLNQVLFFAKNKFTQFNPSITTTKRVL